MSAGMAEVVAAHGLASVRIGLRGPDVSRCKCEALRLTFDSPLDDHTAHVAEELAKAGYGDVREASAEALRAAAAEAHIRGDIGKEDQAGTPVEAFLEWRARLALSANPYREAPHGVD